MANKKSGSEDGEKKGNSRLRIVVIALAILVVAGGVYIFLGRGAETAPAATGVAVVAPVLKRRSHQNWNRFSLTLRTTASSSSDWHCKPLSQGQGRRARWLDGP